MEIQGFTGFNMPGLLKVQFTEAENISSISPPDDSHQVTVNLNSGIEWDEVYFTPLNEDVDLKHVRDDSGDYWTFDLKLINPKLTSAKAEQFKLLLEKDFVFLLTTHNGTKLLIGTPENPARLSYEIKIPGEARNQRIIKVDALMDIEPYFVIDEIIITGGAFDDSFSNAFDI